MPLPKPLPITGFGLLGMTWRPSSTPDEQAFSAMKTAISHGATIWSSSSVYGMPPQPPTAGLHLLRRYFDKYPEDAEKVTLFIRACLDPVTLSPTCTRAGVRASFNECRDVLGDAKKIDIFGPARIDKNVSVDETLGAFRELMDEGLIGGVGLSEVGATTIRKAHAVCPLSVVEVEFSLWSTDILRNGVAEACKDLDVPILTYAPLGYGFLTGQNFSKNLELVDRINHFARQRGVTPAQLALAWIRAHSNSGPCGTIIPIPGATAASRVEENCTAVPLAAEEKEQLDAILKSFDVVGERQVVGMTSELWG
ncbi:aldo/keto reductase family protein [Aspergillus vadensis CBS 113365]|uniref:Pyridoxal reductase n=1 Tax=Aspergillus vadensis (strain CBS 113365 / IMI 142717 / IBT 24658) TaxID=1448311 RepID=A0A319AXX2_ASPVC|nr:pyridoxal reductase [Aspergillus vadensis CBS 113365]PYH64464.1 pyridoxal reductase [Aspergillus vadensis CBS 113365]